MAVTYNLTLEDISLFMEEQGFYYSNEQIYNFYNSLITKPFIILSGVSGSGKSKIADLFAEYMSQAYGNDDNYELISVKPNWTDSRGIFGYYNLLNGLYQITPTLKLFLRALANPEKPYFLVLDEMNLAKVEFYFSDFLSLIESRRPQPPEFDNSQLSDSTTLSEAIILSALQTGADDFHLVEDYRNSSIAQWWLSTHSKGDNPTEQFRTELNQKRPAGTRENGYRFDGSRLAGKAFWAAPEGGSYKLKKPEEMDSKTRERFLKLSSLIITKIKQDKITLHDSPHPLPTTEGQVAFLDNSLNNNNDNLFNTNNTYYVPNSIEIPLNVFIIGTVNVDETTYMFSPKVLDRSNVLEFNDVDLFNAFDYGQEQITLANLPSKSLEKFQLDVINIATAKTTKSFKTIYPDKFEIIVEVFNTLKIYNKQFGYRVFNEISLFILNYCGESATLEEVRTAIDIQILQKILPKISGPEDEILELLNKLLTITEQELLPRSKRKLERMHKMITTSGYATFIE